MKRLLSTGYSEGLFNLSIFLLRISLGILICLNHGLPKLANYSTWRRDFYNPFHIGSGLTLALSIFAEVFAAMLLVLGLFSRLSAFILVINMLFASFIYHRGHPIDTYENALLYLAGFLCILLVGPGKISVDGIAGQ
jgi:putative oxidoreductase